MNHLTKVISYRRTEIAETNLLQSKAKSRAAIHGFKMNLFAGGVWLAASVSHAAGTSRLVIFDNDFFGPASTDLQAAALLLNSADVKTLGLTVVTGDGWRDEEV
jgi:hypothetical protein